MIQELEKTDYLKVRHLFSEREYVNSFRSHLERTPVAKRVLVDNTEEPQTAVIIVPPRVFLGGKADNMKFNEGFRKYIEEILIPEYKKLKYTEVDFYIGNEQWEKNILDIIEGSFLYDRYYYEIKELRNVNWRSLIPEGYSIAPVNLNLLENTHLKNYDWLEEEILENWEPLEEGLQENRGFYLVKDEEEIVAWCTSEYLTESNDIEVGIATRNEYQKKGFATIVGSATAEYCIPKYSSVGWHCGQTNVGSWKTAEKIGFERILEYKKASYIFNKVDLWVLNGYWARQREDFQEAAKLYETIIDSALNETEDYQESYYINSDFPVERVSFRLSECYASLNNKEKALEALEFAIRNGYKDKEQFNESKFLKRILSVKELTMYQKLLE
jgi:RimJ/RimL family protein N-acetyltransferase